MSERVVVENNLLGDTESGQEKFVQEHGKNIASCSTNPGGAACQKGLAMNDALMIALPAGLGGGVLAAATPEIAMAAAAKAVAANAAKNIASDVGKINAGKFGQLELNSLSKTGTNIDPAAKSGNFTVAGRALQKHGSISCS